MDTFFEPDPNDVQSGLDRLFTSDAIHLSGGSTAGFLRRLRAAAMLQPLREWARKGGVLIGTSAGAILMTPTIAVDALFSKAEPREMVDADALNLVPFEYFPHLDADATYLPLLVAYSRTTARCIIACKDGDGVVVSNNRVSMVGDPILIFNGSFEPARDFAIA